SSCETLPGDWCNCPDLGCPHLADEISRDPGRARKQRGRPWTFRRTAAVSAFSAGRAGTISVRGGAGGHLDLLHSVCAGIHASAGESGGGSCPPLPRDA